MIRSSKSKRGNILFIASFSLLFFFGTGSWALAGEGKSPQRVAQVDATNYQSKYLGSFHVGGTYPLDQLDRNAESNIHVRVDKTYRLNETQYLMLMAGLSQFTTEANQTFDHPRWLNLSANYMLTFGPSPRHYFQAGPGYYKPSPGSWDWGFNIGYGRFIPVYNTPCIMKFGLDWHCIYTDDEKTQFLTFQLGVLFNLWK